MEHFILNGKIITLEKNKDTALPIPVMFNASDEFKIEISEKQFRNDMVVEFCATSISKETSKRIQVALEGTIHEFRFIDFPDIEPKDYMLYSCKSNQSTRFSLSILAKN